MFDFHSNCMLKFGAWEVKCPFSKFKAGEGAFRNFMSEFVLPQLEFFYCRAVWPKVFTRRVNHCFITFTRWLEDF